MNEEHRLLLPGTYNLRYAGGYHNQDGRWVLPFRLFRSDSLHELSAEGQRVLLGYGLRTVIDLRREGERLAEPNVLAVVPQVCYQPMPLYNSWWEIAPEGEPPESLLLLYQTIVDRCQEALGAVLHAAAQPHSFPLLVHCKVGKDRTGIVIALLLGAIGVPYEIIVADYAVSQHYLEPLVPELMAVAQRDGLNLERYARLLESPAETMQGLLAYLDSAYGGIPAYLTRLGLTAEHLQQLRGQLLLPYESTSYYSQQKNSYTENTEVKT